MMLVESSKVFQIQLWIYLWVYYKINKSEKFYGLGTKLTINVENSN